QGKIPKKALRDPIANLRVLGIPVGKFFGRDGCRTPMQWDNSKNAGFSPDPNTIPWLPISSNSDLINVKVQEKDEKSMLSYFKAVLSIRKTENVLSEGTLDNLNIPRKNCLMFERKDHQEGVLVILNFNKKQIQITNPYPSSKAIFSTEEFIISRDTTNSLTIHAYEGLLLKFSLAQ
ncbi:MAG: hypothetical protein ACFFDI_31435, partial [Promethearchaeota archaeon]